MARQIRYDAFISYRHCSPDSDIAERLQKRLESFRFPQDVAKKVRRSRLRRVFRDETELGVSDDLSEAIEEAIRNSDYLIAVCSPQYLESVWCQKEIETFLQLRDRKHVLIVLADGEPDTAFPQILMYDEIHTVGSDGRSVKSIRPREPLAADCRGEHSRDRNPKIDKAAIRIIAAMFGLQYDDLEQRHKRAIYNRAKRRVLTAFAVLLAVIAICVGFLVKIAGQNREIAKQNEYITSKYEDSLAAASDNLLRDGRRIDAVYAARLALSNEKTDSFSELATKALVNALGIYDAPDTFSCTDDITLPCYVAGTMYVSPSGVYGSLRGIDYKRYVFDLYTGEMVLSFNESYFTSFVFDGEDGFAYREDDTYKYYNFATNSIQDLGIRDADAYANEYGEGYVLISSDRSYIYKGCDLISSFCCSEEGISLSPRSQFFVDFIPGKDEVWITASDFDQQKTVAFIINTQNGNLERKTLSDTAAFYNCFTDGSHIVWTESDGTGTKVGVMSVNTGETHLSSYIDNIYEITVCEDQVIVLSDSKTLVMDLNLDLLMEIDTETYVRIYNTDYGVVLMNIRGKCFKVGDRTYTSFEPDTYSDITYWEKALVNDVMFMAETGDNHLYIYTFHQSGYMQPYSGDYEGLHYWNDDDPEVVQFRDAVMQHETGYTEDQIYSSLLCENADLGLIQLWSGEVMIYNSQTGEKIKSIYSIEGTVCSFYYDEELSYYYISSRNVEVYDEEFRNLYEIRNCGLEGFDPATDELVVEDYNNNSGDHKYYLVHPVTYEEMISIADDYLSGYEPDERINERYGLG